MIFSLREAAAASDQPLTQPAFRRSQKSAGLEPEWIILRFGTWSRALAKAGLQNATKDGLLKSVPKINEAQSQVLSHSQTEKELEIAKPERFKSPSIGSSKNPEMDFIQYLKEHRKRLGLSQIRVARMVSQELETPVTDSFIMLIENGSRSVNKEMIRVIVRIFDRESDRQGEAVSWGNSIRSFLNN